MKFKFIAAQIAENEKIDVTNEQLAQHIAFLAQREGLTMEKMVDRVRKNNAFGLIRQQTVQRQSVLDFLLKEAKFGVSLIHYAEFSECLHPESHDLGKHRDARPRSYDVFPAC